MMDIILDRHIICHRQKSLIDNNVMATEINEDGGDGSISRKLMNLIKKDMV